MLAKPQGFPRKLGGCAGLDPRLRSAVSAGVGDGERGLRRGLRAPGVGVRPKWVLEYSPSNKRIRYFVSITYVRTGLWTAHKFCGGGKHLMHVLHRPVEPADIIIHIEWVLNGPAISPAGLFPCVIPTVPPKASHAVCPASRFTASDTSADMM